jgi:hypothetical protein
MFARHYRGPGCRVIVNVRRLIDFSATQTGNLVRGALDEGQRAVEWTTRHLDSHPRPNRP